MRHTDIDSGFVVCCLLNMFLNWEVGALALALWIASEWFGLSWYPALVVLAIWIGGAIVITGIFSWASHGENRLKSNDDLPNVNPYSIDPYAEYKQKKDNGR